MSHMESESTSPKYFCFNSMDMSVLLHCRSCMFSATGSSKRDRGKGEVAEMTVGVLDDLREVVYNNYFSEFMSIRMGAYDLFFPVSIYSYGMHK